MRRYVVLIAFEPSLWEDATDAQHDAWFADHHAFHEHLETHGRCLATAPLASADTATTLRHVDGRLQVTDGPYAETAEVLAGYYDVELPDLDAAIAAAALLPPAFTIEIRPVELVEA